MKSKVLVDIEDTEWIAETHNTWHIENWRNLARKERGPTFECGGFPWRVLFFPYGNGVDCASFYLEHGFNEGPPADWYACIQFSLVLWNPQDPSIHTIHHATHRFTAKEGDWGFTRFVELRKAFNTPWEEHSRPLVENDEAMMTAYVRVIKDPTGVLWHNFEGYDSKKETGMVGLKNQGATCYLNSLLQSLYFTNAFRKAVYQIPTEEEQVRTNSAWTLQRLFYRLQMDNLAVSTNELTASFGWDSRQIFEQQDVQELSRILMERLEERMKGTAAENALPQLFVGKSKTYISCINVDFESSRIEDFWDIQLNVRGNKTLHDSFMDYIQVETLEGENKYDAGEPYKLQDAKKGVIFESFPPVLHLQLKRFEYDINRDAMMKVNDRHEFPGHFDAAPYLSKDADMSESWEYQLHGVLVHSGDIGAGHYYAFLRPTKDGSFYKFDDDRVTKSTMKEALDENYGGEYNTLANGGLGQRQPYMRGYSTKRSMNAYMLVYIRKSRLDQVLLDVTDANIPSHLGKKIAEDQAELARRKKEREEAHLYLSFGLITPSSFQNHHAFDLCDYEIAREDPSAAEVHRVLRSTRIADFTIETAERLGVDAEQVRFWVMVGRQNKTNRPDQPIRDPKLTIDEVVQRFGTKGKAFYMWTEVAPKSADGKVGWPEVTITPGGPSPVLVFLKHFDVKSQTLTGIGHVYVNKHAKVSDLVPQICEIMHWDPSTKVSLYEEIKFSMIESMVPKKTFAASEIQDGDIITFQQIIPDLDLTNIVYTDPKQYYDYLLNRIPVSFRPMPAQEGKESFTLSLSKKMTYEQFSAVVGEHLKVDPTHLRFATVHATNGKPKAFVKRNNPNQTLHTVLSATYSSYGYNTHRPDALFYEILETSLADFETKKNMKITWLAEGVVKEEPIDVLVPKLGTVADIVNGIGRKLNLDENVVRNVRLFEAHGSKNYKELSDEATIGTVTDQANLYAEKIPDDELNATGEDRAIFCFHFDKEPSKPHGTPFKFVLKPGEVFKDTKQRISKRTGIKGKLLEQIKFALCSRGLYAKPRYLEDEDVVLDLIGESDEWSLGLDHVNKNRSFWGRTENMFIK
jgi:ubiquitin carboxyl-terminal hydrolase 7